MERFNVAIIIPAFNESRTIGDVVRGAARFGRCVVVDDGSVDGTGSAAAEAGADVVSLPANRGYDHALNEGFRRAADLQVSVFVTLDADGQHDPLALPRLLEGITAGAGVVVGRRDHKQRVAESIFARYTTCRYGIADPLCGLKAYSRSVYEGLGVFDTYGSVGTQLMLFAARSGFKIASESIVVRRRHGVSKFGSSIRGNFKILRALVIGIAYDASSGIQAWAAGRRSAK